MSKSHWIAVKATKKGSKIEFEPDCDELWDGNKFVFNKNAQNMQQSEVHMLSFVLDDRTGLGLRFPPLPDDAMWVKEVPDANSKDCPGSDDHDYSVMKPLNVLDGGKRLIVKNTNPDHRKWSFSLNFVKNGANENDASNYVCWDPIGDNQDSGHPLSSNYSTAFILSLSGAVATATYLALTQVEFVGNWEKLGTALLISLTVGFAFAALVSRWWERR